MRRRTRYLGDGGTAPSTPLPNGGTRYTGLDDVVSDTNPDGTLAVVNIPLANKAAWLQNPVYIAAGAGVLLGIGGAFLYKKYGK